MNNQTSFSASCSTSQKPTQPLAGGTHWFEFTERAMHNLARGCFVLLLLVGATPAVAGVAEGSTLWANKCDLCHGTPPDGARVNAANKSSIITAAISAVGSMNKFKSSSIEGGSSGSDPLSATNRTDLALYLESVFTTNNLTRSTAFETSKTINVSADVVFGTSVTNFSKLVTGSDAVNHGSVSFNDSTLVITYTPSNGWVGDDTFSYVACNSNSTICTANRTITVTTNPPPVPVITSSLTKNGTVGVNLSYTITASNGPTSFTATSLPPGLNKSGSVISGIPTTFDTSDTATLSATNEGGIGPNATLTFSIAKGDPNLTMATQISTQPFRPNTTFQVAGPPTTESPAAVTYTVTGTPSGACTISGTTITKVAVGSCAIVAHQVSSANWTSDDSPTKTVTISPAVQTLVFPIQTPDFYAFSAGATFPIDVVTSSGGSGNPVVYSSANTGVCTVSGTTVTMVAAGDCVLRANQAGTPNYSAASQATQLVVLSAGEPDSPTVTAAIGGDSRATVVFTAPPNPGSPITSYTATCSLGGGSPQVGTSNASPIVVLMPVGFNGAPWSCLVTATNAIGTSDPSNSVSVSPMTSAAATIPVVRSANNVTFTIGTTKSFQVVATGTPNPTVFRSGTAPPASVPFTTVGQIAGTGLLSGTPALGTVGTYNMTFSAANGSGQANQAFVLTIAKASQTITFADPADRAFSTTTFAFAATASSGIAVTYASSTTPVCTVTTAGVVTMVMVGTCTITASQIGDANYLPATPVPQSFQINQTTQSIGSGVGRNPWGTPSNRTFIANGMFALSPLAVATSGLTVSYASLTNAVCTISGTTITMVGAGTCTIEASQDGNANYAAAADQQRSFTINKANQTITFPAQNAQPFSDGGTFMITAATGGASGNPVTYTSLSTGICTINGTLITIVSVGVCTIAANQIGDGNYNAATQVTATIAINAVAAGSPIATGAVGSDGKATISITPPGTDGGSPITGFTATCNPGNLTGSAASSPIVVTGLANTVQHTCSVVTSNAIGNSAPSNAITVTPFLDTGAALWTAACSGCHGALPAGTRFNAAGTTSTVLQYARANVPEMLAQPDVQALTANELAEIAKYIQQQIPAIGVDTAYQTPKLIDIGFPVDLTLNTVSFTSVEAVTLPTNGVLSAFTGTTVTYTPNAGFAGTDTFTYRGKRTSPTNLLGDPRTVTVNVLVPSAPVVTSLATANGVFGQLFNYQITATNSPASFGANNLPPGIDVAPASGVISGSPTAAGVFNATITATNPGGTSAPAPLTITISAASQSITFGAQASQPFSPGGNFAVNPTATATSGLIATYSSLTTNVCTVNATTVTMLTAGTCIIAANQAGNANVNAALQVTQDIAITATAPGAPSIGAATPGDLQATIAFTPPANNGGSAITSYNATCSPSGTGNNAVSPITVSGLSNGTLYTCSVTATSAAGTSVASGTVMVTPNSTPVAPAITSVNATTFTVLAVSTFTVTATGTPPPAITQTTGTLPTGIAFNSGVLSGTPASGTVGSYPLTMTATGTAPAANQSFTLTIAKANQTITFANPGARNFSTTPFPITATSTSGISVVFTSNTTNVCTVVGTSVTILTTGVCSISADVASTADYFAANTVTQGFSISPASQSISFGAQTTPRNFSTSAFAISPLAAASSGLTVIYSSTTPGVCSVSGTNVSPITAGTCTIAANQGGNANFSAASQITQSITITAVAPGAPTIGIGTGSDMQVNVGFTPPQSNGGNPISQYNATCTPSGTGSGNASPVAVTGLSNGTTYTCSVTATNTAALTGPASGTVTVTPTSANGAALWLSVCDVCHTQTPSGNQLNGAGSTATVLNHVRATQSSMFLNSAVQALNQAELAALAAYIGNVVPVNEVTTAFNTPSPINVSSHITLNTISFTSVEVVTPPANGVLSAFTGTSATYTPNPGFSGTDTFTYRGKRTGPDITGDPRTVSVTVVGQVPVINSAPTLNGTFGQAVNYQITASGSPSSFDATVLPAALSINTGNGAITGIASVVGNFNSTISATNVNGTGSATLSVTIAQGPQTILFGLQTSPRAFSLGSFAVAPLASGGASGNELVYTSTTPNVCAVVGTTVTTIVAGLCTISVNQDGNADYAAATEVTQNVTIDPSAPGAPTIDSVEAGNAQAIVSFTPSANTGGAAISIFTATCGGVSVTGGSSPITVSGLANGISIPCTVTATGPGGTSGSSGGTIVTPTGFTPPGAPGISVTLPGNGQATIGFTAPASNGGAPITSYAATCTAAGQVTRTTSGSGSPLVVSALAGGVTYACSVTATNAGGLTSVPSASSPVTPLAGVNNGIAPLLMYLLD